MHPFQITPVFFVSSVAASMRYFIEVLGFAEVFRWDDPVRYGGVKIGEMVLHFNGYPDHAHKIGQGAAYVFAESGILAYWETLKARGARLGGPPERQPYGLIDFTVEDLDGNVLSIGQECG